MKDKLCSGVPECGQNHYAKGWCNRCYQRVIRGAPPLTLEDGYKPKKRGRGKCSVDGCSEKTAAKGLCKKHYNRSRYHINKQEKKEGKKLSRSIRVIPLPSYRAAVPQEEIAKMPKPYIKRFSPPERKRLTDDEVEAILGAYYEDHEPVPELASLFEQNLGMIMGLCLGVIRKDITLPYLKERGLR